MRIFGEGIFKALLQLGYAGVVKAIRKSSKKRTPEEKAELDSAVAALQTKNKAGKGGSIRVFRQKMESFCARNPGHEACKSYKTATSKLKVKGRDF